MTVYNFEVEDWHTYYVSEEEIFVHNMCAAKKSYLSKQEANRIKADITSGMDVKFETKEQELEFIDEKFPEFPEEESGHRSSEGWHLDMHPIGDSQEPVEHINIYSKHPKFNSHITWGEEQ